MDENGLNAPIFSVTEISGHLKRVVEDSFAFVRVRGEISGFKRAASGHLYFRLKDEAANLDAVCWRGTAGRLGLEPEDGLEVIATGRLTTYPGRSNYQIVVDSMEVAGEGALLKLLEDRRKKLAAEGLFDEDYKSEIPLLPDVIGVVTSPTGAVIRDILHRLNDRFPRRVLVWPVMVQGDGAADQIVEAIAGFNRLKPATGKQGDIPRPDVLIVARGGGSLEDLWAFNEENVVRAASESAIPLISAVGHETDTTLIDFASDLRAPTPTAAAEMVVPVRAELLAQVSEDGARLVRSMTRQVSEYKTQLSGLSRGLPDLNSLVASQRQRLDDWAERLGGSLQSGVHRRHRRLAEVSGALTSPKAHVGYAREMLNGRAERLNRAVARLTQAPRQQLEQTTRLLDGLSYERVLERGFALVTDAKGKAVTEASGVSPGDDITVRMKGGDIGARVTGGAQPKPKKKPTKKNNDAQGSLL
ncbi:exodeoxyribonuclease VII large subunit [Magnetovibrio sp. PR-2]|uniref:exodeoxyribonuclease VII large subunit n=1 Tax=Magnetovibrio sp. PR-2 TaxID=3120356 RepID=UPI002FCE68CA